MLGFSEGVRVWSVGFSGVGVTVTGFGVRTCFMKVPQNQNKV